MSAPRIDIEAIKASAPILETVMSYGIAMRRAGREYVGLSPFKAERTPSFYVHPDKGVFHCFASGESGDVITFVQRMEGLNFVEAAKRLARSAGLDVASAETAARIERLRRQKAELAARDGAEEAERMRRARAIWRASRPAAGTLVETYLRRRGIDLDAIARIYGYTVPASLRFHPDLPYRYGGVEHRGPAMVGALRDRARRFTGVHRTWLRADGCGKADVPKPKLTLGVVWGAHGPLSAQGPTAILGEGYETTLSVMGVLAARGQAAFFLSGLSLGNICGGGFAAVVDPKRPGLLLPRAVREALILGDSDGKDMARMRRMIARAAHKFASLQGVETRVAWAEPGKDFNDMVREAA